MIVHHVVPRIHDRASGPSHTVPALCEALVDLGVDTHLHVLRPVPERGYRFQLHGYPHRLPPKRLGFSLALAGGLRRAARQTDVLHNHSLWMSANLHAGAAAHRAGCPLVVSPRGTLQPWALRFHGWRKRLLWLAAQRRMLRRSACIHATAGNEREAIRELGLRRPVAVIPNGVEIPPPRPAGPEAPSRTLLYLGRLHPKKGLELLVQAWSALASRFPDWDLRIVGRGTPAYRAGLERLAGELGAARIAFGEPAFGEARSRTYWQASLFVLPSHSENFGMVVSEALAHELPVMATTGTPWEGLERQRCGWQVAGTVAALTEGLARALACPAGELRAAGARGREWMERDFSWARVGGMMLETYRWLLGRAPPPAWVDLP